jgi:hypothetical protein
MFGHSYPLRELNAVVLLLSRAARVFIGIERSACKEVITTLCRPRTTRILSR